MPWCRKVTTHNGEYYRIFRSLECASCGHQKHEMTDNYLLHPGEAINRHRPQWETVIPKMTKLKVINGGKK